jgi:P-type Cu+ transporter
MKKVKIEIEGMHCASCAANVEKALSKVRGVRNPKVNLLFKKATADVDDNVSEEQVRKAIKDTGYEVKKVEFL